MGASSPTLRGIDLPELMDAIQAGDWSRADLLVQAGGEPVGDALQPVALVHLQFGRYHDAARLLSRIIDRDRALELSRNYARNMAALADHRPEVLDRLEAAPADESVYQLAEGVGGRWTITQRLNDDRVACLSSDYDPVKAAGASLQAIKTSSAVGKAVALYGLGDGYALSGLARQPAKLPFDARQTVYVIQPDARLLHLALMIHDYAGRTGPIADARFHWLIGDDWTEQLLAAMRAEPYLPPPSISAKQSFDAGAIDSGLADVARALTEEQQALAEQIDAYYAALGDDELQGAFRADPPRPPRVLLLTTRYSTVLKHSTADTAAAFAQLGWQVQTVIEPADHLAITALAMKRTIAAVKPDLVMQIDHLRHEHAGMFPDKLPFVCWVQDHLPNLADRRAGAAIGLRDFVLTGVVQRYHRQYGYPRRQLLAMARPTRLAQSPPRAERDGDDLIYISNWSRPPRQVAQAFLERQPAGSTKDLAAVACDGLDQLYERGESIATPWAMHRLIEQLHAAGSANVNEPDRRALADMLFDQVNNAYYRWQGLAWAVEAAEALGLSLGLYGKGWDNHEAFSRFARGTVDYGHPLDELTRRSRFCLTLEPYGCFTHQRTLDALAVGGRVLVRDHPFHHGPPALAAWLSEHPNAEIPDELIQACEPLSYIGEIEAVVRDWMAAGLLTGDAEPLPGLFEVAFDSAASLRARLESPDEHFAQLAESQRQAVVARLSYPAVIQSVIERVGALLADESESRPGASE